MLAAESRAAAESATSWAGWWLFRRRVPPRPEDVARALADTTATWAGPGRARATDTQLVLEGAGQERRTSLATVEDVVADGRVLWVRRRRAHDWLVRCETEADAVRLAHTLGAGR